MTYKMKGFRGFGNSPVKQKKEPRLELREPRKGELGYFPKGYTKEDIKFLKEQREDVVRYEDLDEKGKAIWKKQGKKVPSPTKQKVQLGEVPYMNVGISTQEGKDILKRYKDIPTISSSDPDRVTGKKIIKKNNAKTATKVVGKKVAKKGMGKIIGSLIPGVGWAMAAHDAYKVGKKMEGGHSFKEALKSHYLGIEKNK